MNTPIHPDQSLANTQEAQAVFGSVVLTDAVAVRIFTDLLFASG